VSPITTPDREGMEMRTFGELRGAVVITGRDLLSV
jgi:hypothetical protein